MLTCCTIVVLSASRWCLLSTLPVTHICLQELTREFEAQVIDCESDCVAMIAETEQRCVYQVRGNTAHPALKDRHQHRLPRQHRMQCPPAHCAADGIAARLLDARLVTAWCCLLLICR